MNNITSNAKLQPGDTVMIVGGYSPNLGKIAKVEGSFNDAREFVDENLPSNCGKFVGADVIITALHSPIISKAQSPSGEILRDLWTRPYKSSRLLKIHSPDEVLMETGVLLRE